MNPMSVEGRARTTDPRGGPTRPPINGIISGIVVKTDPPMNPKPPIKVPVIVNPVSCPGPGGPGINGPRMPGPPPNGVTIDNIGTIFKWPW